MNYTQNMTYLAGYAGDSGYVTDPDFLEMLPIWINSAEQRILRDLDLLSTRVYDTQVPTINNRLLTLPTADGSFNLIVACGLIETVNGTQYKRAPLLPMSFEALCAVYPDDHGVGAPSVPRYWAPFTAAQIALGPAPNPVVGVEVWLYGPKDPASLSVTVTETWLSVNVPDILLAAEMILVSAWQRQFSGMADDPAQARNWTQEYDKLIAGENIQELRRKVEASGFGTRQPNPIAMSTTA